MRGQQETALGGHQHHLPCLWMLSASTSKNPTQRHTCLMHVGFYCGIIYDKMGNKPNAMVQPPRGMAHGPRACQHRGVLELGREEGPPPFSAWEAVLSEETWP